MTYTTSWRSKLAALLAILVMAVSCRNKNKDTIELQSENEVGAFFVDSFSVVAGSIQVDSVLSGQEQVSRHLVGQLNSDNFGRINAASYTQIKLPFSDFSFPPEATYTRTELHLISNYFYGDADQNVDVLVYELGEDLFTKTADTAKNYYNFQTVQLGQYLDEFAYNPKEDTVVVPFNDQLGYRIFNASVTDFSSQSNFNQLIQGISFQPTSGDGVIGFDNEQSFIRVVYDDTLSQDFFLNSDVSHFNAIIADRSGTPLTMMNNREIVYTEDLNHKMFVQGGARIDGYVAFPGVDDYLYNTKRGIYKAEIEIIPDDWEYDVIQNVRTWELLLEMNADGTTTSRSEFEPSNTSFRYDITAYTQRVAAGEHHFEDGKLKMAHLNGSSNREVSGNGVDGFTVSDVSENIRLKIYFTEF